MARKVETSLVLDTTSAVQSANKLVDNLKAIKKTVDELSKLKISFEVPENLKELYKLKKEVTKENEKQIKQEESKKNTTEKELTDYQKLLKIKKDYINAQSSSILNTVNGLDSEKVKVQKISEELRKINAEIKGSTQSVQKQSAELTNSQKIHLETKKIMQEARDIARQKALDETKDITNAIEKQKKFNEIYKQQFKDTVKKQTKEPTTESVINKEIRQNALSKTKETMGESFNLKDTATQKEYLKNLAEQKKSLITLEQKETAELIKKNLIQKESDNILSRLKAEGYEKENLIKKHKEELDAYKATLQAKKEAPVKQETMATVNKDIRAKAFEATKQALPLTADKTSIEFQNKYNEILKSMLPTKEKELSISQQINAEIRKNALASAEKVNSNRSTVQFKQAYLSELDKERNALREKKTTLTDFQKLEKEARETAKNAAYEKTKGITDTVERYKQYKSELANILKMQKQSAETTSKPAGVNYLAEMNKQQKKQAYDNTKEKLGAGVDDKSVDFLKEYNRQLKTIKDSSKEVKEVKKSAGKEEKDTYNSLLRQQKQAIWNRVKENTELKTSDARIKAYREEVAKLGKTADKEREKKPIELFSNMQQMTGVFNQIKSFLSSYIAETLELENAVYNLGVVSGKASSQFSQIKNEMLEMSETLPYTARELAKVIETLSRTGRSYDESKTIIKSVSKLAMATGDDLASTADIVTKIFTALKIEAKDTDEVLDSLHSTALMTATDMGKLGEAYKNVGASLSSFTEITSKTGSELTQYKQELIELGNVALGIFANMGKSASNSGVLVRNLTTKMIALEKTGKNMLQQDIGGKVFFTQDKSGEVLTTFEKNVEGYRELTVDALQTLAKEDLPEAVELFAKLYKQGLIRTETMMKIFTVRQGQATASLFSTMGEGYDELNLKINHSRSVQGDYEKQLDNINNKLKIFNNSASSTFKAMGTSMIDSLNSFVSYGILALDILGKLNSKSKEFTGSKTGVVDFFTMLIASAGKSITAIVGVSYAIKGLKAVIAGTGVMSGLGLVVLGILTTADLLIGYKKKLLEQEKELIETAKITKKQLDESIVKYNLLGKSIEVVKNEINIFNNSTENASNKFDNFTLSLNEFMEKIKDIKNVVEKADIFNNLLNEKNINGVKLKISELYEKLGELKGSDEYKEINVNIAADYDKLKKLKIKLKELSENKLEIHMTTDLKSNIEAKLKELETKVDFGEIFSFSKTFREGEIYNIKDTKQYFKQYKSLVEQSIKDTSGFFHESGYILTKAFSNNRIGNTDKFRKDYITALTEQDALAGKIKDNQTKRDTLEKERLDKVKEYLDKVTLGFTEVQNAIEQSKLETVLEKINTMDFQNVNEFGKSLKDFKFEGFEKFDTFSDGIVNTFKDLDKDTFKKVFKDAEIRAKIIALKSLDDTLVEYENTLVEYKNTLTNLEEVQKSYTGIKLTEEQSKLVLSLKKEIEDTILVKDNIKRIRDLKLSTLDTSIKQTNTDTNLKDVLYKILNITSLTKQKQIELSKLKGTSLKDIKKEAELKKDLLKFELETSKENKNNLIGQVASSSKLLSILNSNRTVNKSLSDMSYNELKTQYNKIDSLKNGNKINTKTNELRKILLAILNEEDKIRASTVENDIIDFNTTKETYEYKKKIRDLELEIKTTQDKFNFDKKMEGYKVDIKYLKDIYSQNEKINKLKNEKEAIRIDPSLSLEERKSKIKKINLDIEVEEFNTDKITKDFKESINNSLKNFNLSIPLDFDEQVLNKARENFKQALRDVEAFRGSKVDENNFKNVLKGLEEKKSLTNDELTLKNELIKLLGLEKEYNDASYKVDISKLEYKKKLLGLQNQLNYLMSKSPQFVKDLLQNREKINSVLENIKETMNDKNLTPSQKSLRITELKIEKFNATKAIKNLKSELKKSIESNKITLKYKDDMFGAGAVEQAGQELKEATKAYENFTYNTGLTREENLIMYDYLKTEEAVKQYKLELAKTEASKKVNEQFKTGLSFVATALQGTGAGAGLNTALNTMNLLGSVKGGYAAATAEGAGFLGSAGGYAQMIGAGMQIGNMLMFGGAEKELAKAQAEYQENSTKLDEYRNKLLENQNGIMSEFISQATKIGTLRAIEKSLKDATDITGAGSSKYSKKVSTGLGKSKSVDVLKVANVGISDLGMSIDDMKTLSDLEEARAKALQKMSEGQQKVNSLSRDNQPVFSFSKDDYEQARAELMAYTELYTNLDNYIIQATKNLNEITKSYFGATLEEVKDSSGVITSYIADWTDLLGTINTDIVSSLTSGTGFISTITSNLFSGLRSNLVQNNPEIIRITDNITDIFDNMAVKISTGMNISSQSIRNLVTEVEELKETQEELSQASMEFISTYLQNGGLISDIYAELDTGSKTVYDSIINAFSASNYEDLANNLGKTLFDNVFQSFYEQSINENYTNKILELSSSMTKAMNSGSINSLSLLSQEAQALSLRLEQDRQSYNALRSLYEYDGNIEYTSEKQNITYDTGTSTQTVYNYYVTTNLDVGVGIGTSEEWDYVGERITGKVIDVMQYDKGYDLGRLK